MKTYPSNLVLLVILGLQSLIAAHAFEGHRLLLQKRAVPHFGETTSISYEDIEGGGFRPNEDLRITSGHALTRATYSKQALYNGVPMYLATAKGYKLHELQRGYTDFGTIHIVAPPGGDKPHLTITRNPDGTFSTKKASEEVQGRIESFLAAKRNFGDTAAIVAYGHTLDPVPRAKGGSWFKAVWSKGKPPSPPEWNGVEASSSRARTEGLQAARDLLNSHRSLAFTSSSNGDAKLIVRLLEDGTQTVERFVGTAPVFSPHA
ncbi:conserved hypothetical protein [Sporisorium reilianum SRZ2]|uniref:Uncharacterized protein n=1 Tax=Sporisorium reilianum (strain SRZ2) TaxID=999809 RepID=E6ZMA2_SPORE|nr:conserved hypothetical protein [Sporisorium reilianum SRZ2]